MLGQKIYKVSCVMVTTGRINLVKRSIHCYLGQSYSNRELIVVSQGDEHQNRAIKAHISSLERDDILFVEAPKHLCLGAMRNLSVELTTGELICQWDDDDIFHPERIKTQYRSMVPTSSLASFYSEFLKYFADTGDLYCCNWSKEHQYSHRYLCGTAMFFKSAFHEYRNILYPEEGNQCRVEEDLNVLEKLMIKGKIAAPSEGHHYVYIYHGANTYDLTHHKLSIDTTWRKTLLGKDALLEKQHLIEETLRFGGVTEPVNVRSGDKLAFTFRP